MIRPDFFDSETLGECSIQARMLFIGLWVMGDDYGNIALKLRKLQRQIFPYDDYTSEQFVGFLSELESVGCIKCYEVDGDLHATVPNFNVYQTVNRPTKSNIPKPPESLSKKKRRNLLSKLFSEDSVNAQGALSLKKERNKEEKDSYESFSKENTPAEIGAEETADSAAWEITDDDLRDMVEAWRRNTLASS